MIFITIIPIYSIWSLLTDERCKRYAWESLIKELFTEEIFRY